MSSHRGDLAFTNPLHEDTSATKKLANSRWAPGGFEDQMISNQQMAIDQAPNNKATTTALATGIYSSRWATGPAEHIQTQHKKKTRFNQKRGQKATEKKHLNLVPNQPFLGTNNHEPSTTKTIATPSRLVGELSEEEKIVKMENPFFDPEKHKGLGSSRWANNDEPSFATQTTATPRRIIGELSGDEKAVKVENPFFDPKKHKGLGSSRWA